MLQAHVGPLPAPRGSLSSPARAPNISLPSRVCDRNPTVPCSGTPPWTARPAEHQSTSPQSGQKVSATAAVGHRPPPPNTCTHTILYHVHKDKRHEHVHLASSSCTEALPKLCYIFVAFGALDAEDLHTEGSGKVS